MASPVRHDMIEGSWLVIDVLQRAWVELARWYPPKHFDGLAADEYFRQHIRRCHVWNSAIGEPDGMGSAGREAAIIAYGDTLTDIESAVVTTVRWIGNIVSRNLISKRGKNVGRRRNR